jgi:hypothetical protein
VSCQRSNLLIGLFEGSLSITVVVTPVATLIAGTIGTKSDSSLQGELW